MTVLQTRQLAPSLHDAWAAYVASHAEATFFHELSWKVAVERAFGHRAVYLLAMRAERVVGVLPMFLIDGVIGGRMLVSQPYATYGGVLADDPETASVLLDDARSIARRLDACSLELRSIHAAAGQLSIRRTHATYRRELPADVDGVSAMLPRKARAAARKAAGMSQLSVEFGDHLLEEVWQLYARSMRRLASPNYPLRFFKAVQDAAPGRTVAQVVRRDGQPVAGLFSFIHRRTMMPYFVGFNERVEIYGLSQHLYAESMRRGIVEGCNIYDFGRSRLDNAGASGFKKLCGFEPQVLEYQDYHVPGRKAPDLSPSSTRWSAARRVWRHLPLHVTRPLGAWLARSIPG